MPRNVVPADRKYAALAGRSLAVRDPQGAEVKGYRSVMNLSEGKIVCALEAPDREALVMWFAEMKMPCDSIVQVEYEGDRGRIEPA